MYMPTKSTWKSTSYNTKSYGTSHSTPWRSGTSTKFNVPVNTMQGKIGSFRTLTQQCTPTGCFTPTTANKWINFVNDGAFVYKFNNQQFNKLCNVTNSTTNTSHNRSYNTTTNHGTFSNTAAFNTLRKKFGAGIKAVTKTNSHYWLVAATPSVSARPFTHYAWK
jgi:hypothetical protein